MIVHNVFSTTDGRSYRFRRVVPDDTYSGIPGIYALTHAQELTIEPLRFEAANDLGCISLAQLSESEAFKSISGTYPIGVAVYPMPHTTSVQRKLVADALNVALNDDAKAA